MQKPFHHAHKVLIVGIGAPEIAEPCGLAQLLEPGGVDEAVLIHGGARTQPRERVLGAPW